MNKKQDVIVTDGQGRPFLRPVLADFASFGEYCRAVYDYNDRIHDCANNAFDKAFRAAMKAGK